MTAAHGGMQTKSAELVWFVSLLFNLGLEKDGHCRSVRVTESFAFAFLSSSKLKENLTELHIIVRTTG